LNNFESKCRYVCDDGYHVPAGQNSVRVCSYTGRWRGGTPVCQGGEFVLLEQYKLFTETNILKDIHKL